MTTTPRYARGDTPVVLILGGISANRRVDEWWGDVIARSDALSSLTVIGADWLDGPGDQVRAIVDECRAARIEHLEAVIGSSYGGMIALAIAEREPGFVGRVIAISAAHASHPMAQAHRWLQREIIALGQAADRPNHGVALARALAMTTYRTAREFRERFGEGPGAAHNVVGYLAARGADYAERFRPEQINRLTRALDDHWIDPELITVPVDLIGVRSDALVPPWQLEDLAARLPRATLTLIDSRYGHDAFLKEPAVIAGLLDTLLATEPVS